jgi:hypothetical protein
VPCRVNIRPCTFIHDRPVRRAAAGVNSPFARVADPFCCAVRGDSGSVWMMRQSGLYVKDAASVLSEVTGVRPYCHVGLSAPAPARRINRCCQHWFRSPLCCHACRCHAEGELGGVCLSFKQPACYAFSLSPYGLFTIPTTKGQLVPSGASGNMGWTGTSHKTLWCQRLHQ